MISYIKQNRKEFLFIIAVLLAGTLLRILYLIDFSSLPLMNHVVGADVEEYNMEALAILKGRLLPQVDIHAPLYSYFLALLLKITGNAYFGTRLIQSVIGLLAGIPLFLILKDNFLSSYQDFRKYTPYVFLMLFSIYPPLIAYQSELFSENLLLPLIALSMFFLHKFFYFYYEKYTVSGKPLIYLLSCGFATALAIITHPISIFYALFLVIYIFCNLEFFDPQNRAQRKRNLLALMIFIFALSSFPVAVSVYNSAVEGRFVFVQKNSGFNFYLGNSGDADGTCRLSPGPEWDEIHDYGKEQAELTGKSKDAVFLGESLDFILKHPFQWIKLLFRKAFLTLSYSELTTWSDVSVLKLTVLHKYLYNVFAFLAIPGLLALFTGMFSWRFREDMGPFLLVFFSFLIACTITVTSGRYRLPLVMAVIAFASYFFCAIPWILQKRRRVMVFLFSLPLAVVSVFLVPPPANAGLRIAYAHLILGESYLDANDPANAEKHLLEAQTHCSDWQHVMFLFTSIHQRQGKIESAREGLLELMRRFPDSYYNFMNYGIFLMDSGDFDGAHEYFQKAFALVDKNQPSDLLYYNMGKLEHLRENFFRAEEYYKEALEINPYNQLANNNYALLLMRAGRFEPAEQYARKAVRLAPDDPVARTNLALILHFRGKNSEARKIIDSVLKDFPHYMEAETLKKRITQTSGR